MYCPSCSKEVPADLTFCNHCGYKIKLKNGESKKSELSLIALITAIVSVFIVGFGCIVAILALMKNLGFKDEMIAIVIVLSFATILFVEGVFLWLLMKGTRGHQQESPNNLISEQPRNEIYSAPVRSLGESTLQPISVTEHTTRTLDSIPKNKN